MTIISLQPQNLRSQSSAGDRIDASEPKAKEIRILTLTSYSAP
jgi:hypothetical protein